MKKTVLSLIALFISLSIYAWKPIFAGHRGGYTGVECTSEAYNNGVDKYGYSGLECDVRVTSDGQYVLQHDETTTRLGGALTVANSTLAQLKAETLTQTRGGVTYTGKICTVAEYLEICKDKNAFPLMELKWTTGINNSDMSKFAGLVALIDEYELRDKVVFLTSMKNSIEYIRKNFPNIKCQFLTGEFWANHFDWCVAQGVDASIQAGYFDIYTVKKFHDAGLNVAVWTVNDAANYKNYGEMGVQMMTCDYLYPSQMAELEEVNFDEIPDILDPLEVDVTTLWRYCAADNNMLADFPSAVAGSKYTSAQQAAVVDGVFYANDYKTGKLLKITQTEVAESAMTGTNSIGTGVDDAGNLVLRNDGVTSTPNKLVLYKKGSTIPTEISFTLLDNGQANFIYASGDLFSAEGGYVYIYPNKFNYVNILKIAEGALVSVTRSAELSLTASTAGVVIPIGNDPNTFIYQLRSTGYGLYKNGVNKGDYAAGVPKHNSTVGGAYFTLGGHELFVHPSASNYNGSLVLKDMSAKEVSLASFTVLGSGGYAANTSTGVFLKAENVDENSAIIYAYCMGNGIAAYKVALKGTGVYDAKREDKGAVSLYPNPANDILNISYSETISSINIYNITGAKVVSVSGNETTTQIINVNGLQAGTYLVTINGAITSRMVKK